MKYTKTSVTSHLFQRYKFVPASHQVLVYQKLKDLLKKYENQLTVKISTPVHYELWTTHIFRSSGLNSLYNKKGIQFSSVVIHKKYTSLYFHPLYVDKELRFKATPALQHYLKGVTCFHFTTLSNEVIADLNDLLELGWAIYKELKIVY
jgi:hypothetical protein